MAAPSRPASPSAASQPHKAAQGPPLFIKFLVALSVGGSVLFISSHSYHSGAGGREVMHHLRRREHFVGDAVQALGADAAAMFEETANLWRETVEQIKNDPTDEVTPEDDVGHGPPAAALAAAWPPRPAAVPAPAPATPAPRDCASARYWRAGAGSSARRALRRRTAGEPASDGRFVTFEPDHGGWNNIRMGMETAALFAWSTGRTLVLPPAQRLYLVSNRGRAHGPFDFYDLELIAKGGGVITMEKYLELRTGRPTVDGCAAGKKCDGLTAQLRRLGATAEWRPRVDFLLLGSRYGAPGAAQAASIARHAKGRRIVDVDADATANATTIHFATDAKRDLRFLTHYYTFMRWATADRGRAARRVARDELRYRAEIQCAAAAVVDFLAARAGGRPWAAAHVRRGDFQFKAAKVDAGVVAAALDAQAKPAGAAVVYVATDEGDRAWFGPLAAAGYDLVFLSDVLELGAVKAALDADPNWAGMVEQLVAAAADVFLGTWWSTFTGYITRVRGYRGKRNATFYVLPEYRDAFAKPSPPAGGAAWWREWPTAFELIDDAPG